MTTDRQPNLESPATFWTILIESLRGSHRTYTEGPLGTAILTLAIPMVLEMAMESVFAVADIFFVGKLGPEAVATVGLTESLLLMIYTVAVGLSIGVTALVARRTGERDATGAAEAAVQTLLLGAGVSIVLGILGATYASELLALMGASEAVIREGAGYARVMLGGNIVILTLFLANAVFRGAGDGVTPMRALWLANAINIALAPCLIFGLGPIPALGVVGAGIATTIGRGIGAAYTVYHLLKGNERIRIHSHQWQIVPRVMTQILKLSSSGMLQAFLGMASWIGLVRVVSSFGDSAMAGYTIGMRVVQFALFPAFGLSNAAATLVGQSLGAKDPDRAERAVWLTGFYNLIFLGSIGLIFVIFPSEIVGWFTQDPQVAAFGTDCLRIVAFGFVFYAYGLVVTSAFNGAGDIWTPTLLNLFAFWILEIPLAYFLATHAGMGPRGVFLSVTIAFSALAVASAVLFKRGRWKTQAV